MDATFATDFPFVAELPKREKSHVANLWDVLQQLRQVTAESGPLLPIPFAASLLGVHVETIRRFVRDERLVVVDLDGRSYITEKSFVEFAKLERKAGRPLKCTESNTELLNSSISTAVAMLDEQK